VGDRRHLLSDPAPQAVRLGHSCDPTASQPPPVAAVGRTGTAGILCLVSKLMGVRCVSREIRRSVSVVAEELSDHIGLLVR
jgi:hypothetical protein